jgi:hypothetical protein
MKLFTLALLFLAHCHGATVFLKNAFIEANKNRVTIDVHFIVDHAHKKPNAPDKDGDLHTAGRADEIGLPMVSEVVNAAAPAQKTALDLIHTAESDPAHQPIGLSGAWRLWFEHPSKDDQIQGQKVEPAANTNPDHVFEIHPITKVQGQPFLTSFAAIPGFQAYDAKKAFEYYESLTCTITAAKTATSITSKKAQYNYAEFVMELKGSPQAVDDGVMVLATVQDDEGNTVVDKLRRMVFVGGTAPAEEVLKLKKGDQLHVIGIPRVNLERVSFITKQKGQQPVNTHLPYEMIIVGVLE